MPDTSTEVALATTTLSSAAASITFSSIPSTYTDLRLVMGGTITTTGEKPYIRFNSDSGSNYSHTSIYGNGTDAESFRQSNITYLNSSYGGDWNSTNPSFFTLDIFSYAGSTNKTTLHTFSGDKNGSGYVARVVGLWRSTSALNDIYIFASGSDTFKTGTTATLYGIL